MESRENRLGDIGESDHPVEAKPLKESDSAGTENVSDRIQRLEADAMNFGSSGEDVVKYEIESTEVFAILVLNAFPIILEGP